MAHRINYRARTPRSFRPELPHNDREQPVQCTTSATPMRCTHETPTIISVRVARGTKVFEGPLRAFMPRRELATV
jgi:hypothetical protein